MDAWNLIDLSGGAAQYTRWRLYQWEIRTEMRLVVALALVVIVGLIFGDVIGAMLGAGSYRGAIPGAVVAVSIFMWRRREEGGSLKAMKAARRTPSGARLALDGAND